MIRSMTGFAAVARDEELAAISVTVRAVNHRYLDVQVRLPTLLAELESTLRGVVQQRLARGRVEVSVNLQLRRSPRVEVEVNESIARALAPALETLREEGLIAGHLTAGDFLRIPHAVTIQEDALEAGSAELTTLLRAVEEAVERAVTELDRMRIREGAFLAADLESRRAALGDTVGEVVDAAAEGQAALGERLARRIEDMTHELAVDPSAVAQEIVRFAARSDVSEEIVRLQAHLEHWTTLASGPEPCGRKLDFLIQEMNREVNTIGSKAEGARVTELIVHAKAELEKMREQVQNVE